MDLCERCHQATVPELVEDHLLPQGHRAPPPRRCLNCGHVHVSPNAGLLTEEGRRNLLTERG